MCLPGEVGNLNCYDANANVLFTGRGSLMLALKKLRRYLSEAEKVVILKVL